MSMSENCPTNINIINNNNSSSTSSSSSSTFSTVTTTKKELHLEQQVKCEEEKWEKSRQKMMRERNPLTLLLLCHTYKKSHFSLELCVTNKNEVSLTTLKKRESVTDNMHMENEEQLGTYISNFETVWRQLKDNNNIYAFDSNHSYYNTDFQYRYHVCTQVESDAAVAQPTK